MKRPPWRTCLAIGIVLSMAALTFSGGYRLVLGMPGANLRIASLLTPSGILRELVVNPPSELAPFYQQSSDREGVLERPWIWGALTINWALGLAWFFRRRRGLS